MWVFTNDVDVLGGTVQVIFSCDYLFKVAASFFAKGMSQYRRERVLKVVGDATHNETPKKVKPRLCKQPGMRVTHFTFVRVRILTRRLQKKMTFAFFQNDLWREKPPCIAGLEQYQRTFAVLSCTQLAVSF